ncbi:carboxypeptidase-like regulatory domain-containing protein [uncultured Psychroserpens sp.]|uniref:carboxypeptidase-like regulatory domain-containing protein n=1 Tax=uncultured Psychroserpens sp. TaxID=255436 RepID=UPI002628C672|nr:carboxypeptidase-like regulatory domain-containing protein [uncultured Psychroserpens sp.]
MRKTLTVNIPKPCHEDWSQMTPQEKGRHCKACEKTVFDFTAKTDEHIVKAFEQNLAICGRFKSTQLNRGLVLRRKEKNNYLSFIASSLFTFLVFGTQEIKAQNTPKITQTDSINHKHLKGKVVASILKEKVISGTVISEYDGLPLPGVNIVIKGTTTGTQTDFDGNYKLKVKSGQVLEFSFLGFETKEMRILQSRNNKLNVALEEDLMGDVVFVGMISTSSDTEYSYTNETVNYQIKKRKERTKNYFAFYKRKLQEEKTFQKLKRQQIRDGKIERTVVGKLLYSLSNIFRKKE